VEVVAYSRRLAPYLGARLGLGERGSAYVEYLLILALIAIACMIAIAVFGDTTSNKFDRMAESVGNA
jgi:Flp pilus assembly pilin Flp